MDPSESQEKRTFSIKPASNEREASYEWAMPKRPLLDGEKGKHNNVVLKVSELAGGRESGKAAEKKVKSKRQLSKAQRRRRNMNMTMRQRGDCSPMPGLTSAPLEEVDMSFAQTTAGTNQQASEPASATTEQMTQEDSTMPTPSEEQMSLAPNLPSVVPTNPPVIPRVHKMESSNPNLPSVVPMNPPVIPMNSLTTGPSIPQAMEEFGGLEPPVLSTGHLVTGGANKEQHKLENKRAWKKKQAEQAPVLVW